MRNNFWLFLTALFLSSPAFNGARIHSAEKRPKVPSVEVVPETGQKNLLLPQDIENAILAEIPNFRVPKESEFNPDMLKYYYSNLVGIFPAVAYGDFNGDKKKDCALLAVTGESKWGPVVEMVIMNKAGGSYDIFRLGEVNNFKDDYIRFNNGKLVKGKYKKGGWFITWDPKKQTYQKIKD